MWCLIHYIVGFITLTYYCKFRLYYRGKNNSPKELAPEKAYFTLYPADASCKMYLYACTCVYVIEQRETFLTILAHDDKSGCYP